MDENALNELLECSVCLERLDHTSKVLPCQHTFCRRCLDEIVLTKQELRCPECRAIVEIKVEDLPNNILLIRLLEGLKTSGRIDSEVALRRHDNLTSAGSVSRQLSSKQMKIPCAKALYDYVAKESGDLGFKKGDVVYLKKQLDENWYEGELSGRHGFFPSSYVQVIQALPQIPLCRALYDFDLKDEKEKDCLVFKKEDTLTVIRRVDENWIEGRKGDKIGIFPLTFVELNDAAKSLVNSKPSSSILQAGNRLPTSSDRTGSSSTSSSLLATSLPQQKRHSFTLASPSSPSPPNPQRHSLEITPTTTYNITMTTSSSTSSNVVSLPPQRSESPETNSPRMMNPPTKSSSSSNSSLTSPVYVSLYNYKSQKLDELELKKGEYYTVNEKCQDGWFKGQCIKSGRMGVFPGNYVQMIRHHSAFKPIYPNVMNIRTGDSNHSRSSSSPSSSSSSSSNTTHNKTSSSSPSHVPPPLLPRALKPSPSPSNPHPPSSSSSPSQTSGHRSTSSSLVKTTQSLSTSSKVTLPNNVTGATGVSSPSHPVTKEKKEKKKERGSKSLGKLLQVGGKIKKSRSGQGVQIVSDNVSTNVSVTETGVNHVRSESYPTNSQGAVAEHKKSNSFDSSVPPKPTRPKPLLREKYRCIVPYPPQTDQELDLQVADIVYVYKKRDDGWYKGTLDRNGKTGLFPGSFVEKFD